MSGKIKELILKLEQEKLKVKRLEKEVERLKAMTLNALVNKHEQAEHKQ